MQQIGTANTATRLSLGGLLEFHAEFGRGCWQVFGLAGIAVGLNGVSSDSSSRLLRKPVMSERSFLLTAAGQFRIRTGFPFWRFPSETLPASDAQHTVSLGACQSKCCGLSNLF